MSTSSIPALFYLQYLTNVDRYLTFSLVIVFTKYMLMWIKKYYKIKCILLILLNIYTCTGKIPGTYRHVSLMVISERVALELVFFTEMLRRHKQKLLSVQHHTF